MCLIQHIEIVQMNRSYITKSPHSTLYTNANIHDKYNSEYSEDLPSEFWTTRHLAPGVPAAPSPAALLGAVSRVVTTTGLLAQAARAAAASLVLFTTIRLEVPRDTVYLHRSP